MSGTRIGEHSATAVILMNFLGAQISHVVSPAVLAVAVLNIRNATYLDAATALFGYYLSISLEGLTGVSQTIPRFTLCSLEW